jgi:hypothetical protein
MEAFNVREELDDGVIDPLSGVVNPRKSRDNDIKDEPWLLDFEEKMKVTPCLRRRATHVRILTSTCHTRVHKLIRRMTQQTCLWKTFYFILSLGFLPMLI